MATELNVWMNGLLVGTWGQSRTKTEVFRYDPRWMQQPASRPLSLSMPITSHGEHRGDVVANYFDNLLPDSDAIRLRLRTRYATKSTHAFDLLTAIGRDCVGAVQLLPPAMEPLGWDRVASEPMDEAAVARALRTASSDIALGQQDNHGQDFRISIAGAQEKTALLRYGGGWHRPMGATPTTHILKLPLGLVGNMRRYDMADSVQNEWLCAQILASLGLPVAKTEMATFEDQKVLVVERFDRRWQGLDAGAQDAPGFVPGHGVWIARLPQEDFCQIVGVPPTQKYQSDGGPGIRDCLDHLANSIHADHDRKQFVLTQLAFWLLAAPDGHAKNFSIRLLRGGGYALTPLYDVLSAWPVIGKGANMLAIQDAKLAMGIRAHNMHYKLADIRVRHWQSLANTCGAEGVWEAMLAMVAEVDKALNTVQAMLPANFPPHVWDKVSAGVRRHARQFVRETDM